MHSRRRILQFGGAALLSSTGAVAQLHKMAPDQGGPAAIPPGVKADFKIDSGTSVVDLGKDAAVSTKTYNGQFPGPLLRMTAGKPVVVDVHNKTDTPEPLHWPGQFLPADASCAGE